MTGQAGRHLLFIHIADLTLYTVSMSSLESVAPGRLRETGDDESGGILSGRSPPQGMLFCLPMSDNEFPVLFAHGRASYRT